MDGKPEDQKKEEQKEKPEEKKVKVVVPQGQEQAIQPSEDIKFKKYESNGW